LAEPASFRSFKRPDDVCDVALAYAAAGADELLLTDKDRPPAVFLPLVQTLSDSLAVPLNVEAEVAGTAEFGELLAAGVSRITLEGTGLRAPDLLARLAREFGSAKLAVAITARREQDVWRVSEGLHGQPGEWDPVTWARVAEAQGAGELIVRSPDGGQHGEPFDLELLEAITSAVRLPVVAAATAGQVDDLFDQLMIGGADAVAIESPLHSGQLTVHDIKVHLAEHGLPVRLS
jgi:cyclase